MDKESLLEAILNSTIERIGRQSVAYESEIASLNAEIVVLKQEVLSLKDDISTTGNIMVSVDEIKNKKNQAQNNNAES
jgi:cell division protein FtsB